MVPGMKNKESIVNVPWFRLHNFGEILLIAKSEYKEAYFLGEDIKRSNYFSIVFT